MVNKHIAKAILLLINVLYEGQSTSNFINKRLFGIYPDFFLFIFVANY